MEKSATALGTSPGEPEPEPEPEDLVASASASAPVSEEEGEVASRAAVQQAQQSRTAGAAMACQPNITIQVHRILLTEELVEVREQLCGLVSRMRDEPSLSLSRSPGLADPLNASSRLKWARCCRPKACHWCMWQSSGCRMQTRREMSPRSSRHRRSQPRLESHRGAVIVARRW